VPFLERDEQIVWYNWRWWGRIRKLARKEGTSGKRGGGEASSGSIERRDSTRTEEGVARMGNETSGVRILQEETWKHSWITKEMTGAGISGRDQKVVFRAIVLILAVPVRSEKDENRLRTTTFPSARSFLRPCAHNPPLQSLPGWAYTASRKRKLIEVPDQFPYPRSIIMQWDARVSSGGERLDKGEILKRGAVRATARHYVWCLARFGVRDQK
jgi:hypothetical protein